MMMGKSDKKRGSFSSVLMLGALAVVGAASIASKGKKLACDFVNKCKRIVSTKKEDMT